MLRQSARPSQNSESRWSLDSSGFGVRVLVVESMNAEEEILS